MSGFFEWEGAPVSAGEGMIVQVKYTNQMFRGFGRGAGNVRLLIGSNAARPNQPGPDG